MAGPIFARIAEKAARYLDLEPHEDIGKDPASGTGGLNQCVPPLSALRPFDHFACSSKLFSPPFPPAKSSGRLIATWKASRMTRGECRKNGLFVALRGEKTDGHQFIDQAIEKGASVIVTERKEKLPRATCLVVENSRSRLADLARRFTIPARRLKMAASPARTARPPPRS